MILTLEFKFSELNFFLIGAYTIRCMFITWSVPLLTEQGIGTVRCQNRGNFYSEQYGKDHIALKINICKKKMSCTVLPSATNNN